MPRCAGRKEDGSPCERIVGASQSYCYSHDPKRAAERRRNASRGGRSKANAEIAGLKAQLKKLAADVLSGEVERGAATAVNQIINSQARLLELERKIKETEELEARLNQAGQGTELMALTDASGLPLAVRAASAFPHEVTLVEAALAASFLRKRPERLIADRAYDSDPLDAEKGIELIVPHRRNRKKAKTQDGCKLRRYKRRWKIERLFAWLGNFRAL